MVGNTKTWVSIGETMQEIVTKEELSTMGGAKLVYAGLIDVTAQWHYYIDREVYMVNNKPATSVSFNYNPMDNWGSSSSGSEFFSSRDWRLEKGTVLSTLPECDYIRLQYPIGTSMYTGLVRMFIAGSTDSHTTTYKALDTETSVTGTDLMDILVSANGSTKLRISYPNATYYDRKVTIMYDAPVLRISYKSGQLILDEEIYSKYYRQVSAELINGDWNYTFAGPSLTPFNVLCYSYQ